MSNSTFAGEYEIDPAGDLIVEVIEGDYSMVDNNGKHPVLKTALMKVSREVLTKNSSVLSAMLGGRFKEASSDIVKLEEDTIQSIELWFRLLHGSLGEGSYSIERKEIWEAIQVSRKYDFKIEALNDWFETYWSRLDKKNLELGDLKELMTPAQAFEYSVAFASITKKLVYTSTGHIEEQNPSRHRQLHLQNRIIQQCNAAKGSMRKEIIKGLFDPMNNFCPIGCAVKKDCLWEYVEAVKKTGIWPLDTVHSRSNESIIESAGIIRWKCDIPEGACPTCTAQLRGDHISEVRSKIINYWQGLCLDCMDISNPKTGDIDADYWLHNDLRKWDRGCRIRHHRNTWYFSFMGRPEIMNAFTREQQDRKKEKAARQRRNSYSS